MKRLKWIYIGFIIALLIILSSPIYAIPNPSYEFYVYDSADLLNSTTESYIIEVNNELYQKTGAQIVVATINDLESMDINRYAVKLFEEWKIGGAQYDNGLLMLIVPVNNEIWIEVGYGLEGILPDSRVKRIIENNIIPYFSQGDFDTGVLSGFEGILDYVEKEYNIELQTRSGDYYPGNQVQTGTRIPSIYVIIGIIIFIFIDFKFFRGWLTFSLLRGVGRGGYRGGGTGGSRGGGGRSGGGGAGGRW